MKIVFLFHVPFQDRYLKSFYVEALMAKGYQVEVWDLSKHFGSDVIFGSTTLTIKKITSEITVKDLEQRLKAEGDRLLVFTSFAAYFGTLSIYRLLEKYNVPTFYIHRGSLPFVQKISFKKATLSKIKNVVATVFRKTRLIKTPDVVFQSGIGFALSGIPIVQINASDFDQCLEAGNSHPNVKSPYIVFLDEYFPYHPDFDFLKWPKVTDTNYFSQMNILFQKLEAQTGAKVVIAAHPKATYQGNPFEGREMVSGDTLGLVRDAMMVVAHSSNSMGYAVIFKKKLLFCNTKEMSQLYADNLFLTAKHMANLLGAKFVITEEVGNDDLVSGGIDEKKYHEFMVYLSGGDGTRKSVDIIEKTLFKFGLRSGRAKN